MAASLVGLLVAVALAGCLGGGDPSPALDEGAAAETATSDVRVEPTPGETTARGSLEARVRDGDGRALAGATVTVKPTPNANLTLKVPAATTGEQGLVRFEGLPAASYEVEASKPGYASDIVGAAVQGGKASKAELRLQELITDNAFNVTATFEGRVTCAYGQGLVLTCQAVREQTKTLGKEHRNGFEFPVGTSVDPPVGGSLFEVWVEARWEETKAADRYLGPAPFGARIALYDPVDKNGHRLVTGGRGDSDPPLRVSADAQILEGWGIVEGGILGAEIEPTHSYASPGLVLDMAFTVAATAFYNAAPDPCWSPLRQAALTTGSCAPAA